MSLDFLFSSHSRLQFPAEALKQCRWRKRHFKLTHLLGGIHIDIDSPIALLHFTKRAWTVRDHRPKQSEAAFGEVQEIRFAD
jgi:hypothetical protein